MLRRVRFIEPAKPAERFLPPRGPEWLHEVKWDGYRCQLHKLGDEAIVFSKNGRDYSSRWSAIRLALETLPARSAVIDAEIVALNPDGTPNFRMLHSGNYSQADLAAWCFDLLELNGVDLQKQPLVKRKAKLERLLERHNTQLCFSTSFDDPDVLLVDCVKWGMEGIVSKRRNDPYRSVRCGWVKVKCAQWKAANADRGDLFQKQ